MTLAELFYKAYPDVGVASPEPGEHIKAYAERIVDYHGDGLFTFIVNELADDECDDISEAIRRLDQAVSDILSVRNVLINALALHGNDQGGDILQLKKTALAAARARGHLMDKWHDLDERNAMAYCVRCCRGVHVNTKPMPNEIDIHGEAVALDCEKR